MNWGQFDSAGATKYSYTFDNSIMLLKDGSGVSVVQTSATFDPNNPNSQFGVMTGPLFEDNTTNAAALKCQWDTTGQSICPWQAWSELPVFYTWETGTNSWNQFTTLKDKKGNFVRLDPPLQVTYVKPDTGAKYQLEYNGFGNLWGIPGKCIDFATGEEVPCGPGTKFIPEFMITQGESVNDVKDSSKTYLVKPLEVSQVIRSVESANCSSLSESMGLLPALPDMGTWVSPAMGAEPKVTASPAVIGGTIQ